VIVPDIRGFCADRTWLYTVHPYSAFLLEVALARRVFRHLEKIARRAKGELMAENAAGAAMEELLRAIRSEIDEHA